LKTFIARQPILDTRKNAYAYELLYRPHVEDGSGPSDPNLELDSTTSDICTFIGVEHLQGKKFFIKTAPDFLLSGHSSKLPKEQTIVEVADIVEATPEVIAACEELKTSGYPLAVDVFTNGEPLLPLIELADFIKIDLLATPLDTQRDLPARFASTGKRFVAERVENDESFRHARELGYQYFQGSFLNRPANLRLKSIPGLKMQYFQLIQELNKPDMDFNKVEGIIKKDLAMSFSLLRYLNSAAFATSREITSIRQALSLLGERAIKKWVSLMALSEMARDKPEELIIEAATRAKLCESLAPAVGLGDRKEELFLMGMFSMLDAILDCGVADALKDIPLATDVKEALTGTDNKLRDVYEYVLAFEDGEWHRTWTYAAKLVLDEARVPLFYIDAVKWVEQSMRNIPK
jgi:c-di-GMP-related signal transduction protein